MTAIVDGVMIYFRKDVMAYLELSIERLRGLLAKRVFPEPDGYIQTTPGKGRPVAFWYKDTLDHWRNTSPFVHKKCYAASMTVMETYTRQPATPPPAQPDALADQLFADNPELLARAKELLNGDVQLGESATPSEDSGFWD